MADYTRHTDLLDRWRSERANRPPEPEPVASPAKEQGVWGDLVDYAQRAFLRGWLIGLGLGGAFLIVALASRDRRIKPWIRLALAALTVAAFARALWEFVARYA